MNTALTVCILLLAASIHAAESLLRPGDRIIFVGDSITAQAVGSPQGYYHQFTNALHAVYPDARHDVIGLGFSGNTVFSWADRIEPDSRNQPVPANTGGFEVRAAFAQPAGIVFILLGMNDILSPTVRDDDAVLLTWKEKYRQLVRAIRSRVAPREIVLCEITPLTEDPFSPKNRVRDRMTALTAELAKEETCRTAATGAAVFDAVHRCRRVKPDYHVIPDTVHPQQPLGHTAILKGMAAALNDDGLVAAFEAKIAAAVAALAPEKPVGRTVTVPVPWRVLCGPDNGGAWGANRVYQPTNSVPFMEAELVAGRHFAEAFTRDGKTYGWQLATPGIEYTAGDDPDTVNPYSLTFGSDSDVLYAVRWVYSEKARPVQIQLSHRTFSATLGFVVWLNGDQVMTADLNRAGKNKAVGQATLKQGWNCLLVRNDHLQWQRQFACALLPVEGDALDDLKYAVLPKTTDAYNAEAERPR
jgi:lysophospholipase L1-like esterase